VSAAPMASSAPVAGDAFAAGGTLRFALVGCGVIGRVHAEVIATYPDLALTVLVDAKPERAVQLAERLARDFGEPAPAVTASLTEALARDDIDVVVVAVPSGSHAEICVPVLQSGRHLVVEKPVDVTLAAARRIADAAAAATGCVATVISQHRFDPASIAVHEAIATGALGRIGSAVATVPWWRSQGYYDSGDWRGTRALDGGGALINQGIHTVDLLLWLLGRPVEVMARTARAAHERIDVEDTVAAVIVFESGALATLHASTAAYPGLTVRLTVLGERGSAVLDNDRLAYLHSRSLDPDAGSDDRSGRGVGGAGNQAAQVLPGEQTGSVVGGGPGTSSMVIGHRRQYADIVRAIRTGTAPGMGIADAVAALATVRAIYQSADGSAPVRVAEIFTDPEGTAP